MQTFAGMCKTLLKLRDGCMTKMKIQMLLSMKTTLFLCKYAIFAAVVTLTICAGCSDRSLITTPNVLLIISDDQGWTDYSFMGHDHIQTPALDRLAAEGITYTHGYVSAPLCRPSLATLATGLYPHQHGVTGNDPVFEFEGRRYTEQWQRKRAEVNRALIERFKSNMLLPEVLSKNGYVALQTGKWWEGHWSEGGFDVGMTHGDPARGGRHGDEGLKIGREGLQVIYDLMDSAAAVGKPFFVWYAPFMPHSPHTPPPDLEQKYLELAPTPAVARYWAMCEWFDRTCGALMERIGEMGLEEETLVLYVCDNGWIQQPDRDNAYAPRSKRSPYEMGIRTPIMVKWPEMVDPLLDTITPVSSIDIVPTIYALCAIDIDAQLPGINLTDRPAVLERDVVFSEAFEHDIEDIDQPTKSLQYRVAIDWPWKIIEPDTTNVRDAVVELFNLADDPHELHNRAEAYPEIVESLRRKLKNWWKPEHLER
jgi:uncharacterized sulfatase